MSEDLKREPSLSDINRARLLTSGNNFRRFFAAAVIVAYFATLLLLTRPPRLMFAGVLASASVFLWVSGVLWRWWAQDTLKDLLHANPGRWIPVVEVLHDTDH